MRIAGKDLKRIERAVELAKDEIHNRIATKTLSEMFLSLDGRDKAQPGYEWRKGWNAAIRQAMDYAQPVPSVTDGWLRAIDEALVTAHIGVANAEDTYEQAKSKLDNLIGFHVGVATDPAVNGGWKLMPVEPTQEMIDHVIDERLDALVAGKEHTFIDIYTAMIAAANPGAQTKGEEK